MIIDTDQISEIIHIVTITCMYISYILYIIYYILYIIDTISNYYSIIIHTKFLNQIFHHQHFEIEGALGTLGTWCEATWEGQASRARRNPIPSGKFLAYNTPIYP